jgi:hypothetical protein
LQGKYAPALPEAYVFLPGNGIISDEMRRFICYSKNSARQQALLLPAADKKGWA